MATVAVAGGVMCTSVVLATSGGGAGCKERSMLVPLTLLLIRVGAPSVKEACFYGALVNAKREVGMYALRCFFFFLPYRENTVTSSPLR